MALRSRHIWLSTIMGLALMLSGFVPATLQGAAAVGALQLSRSTVAPGDTFTVTGSGFSPGGSVVVYADISM